MAEAPRASQGVIDTSVVIELDQIDAERLPNELANSALPWQSLRPGRTPRVIPLSARDVKIAYNEPRPSSTRCRSMATLQELTDASTRRSSRPGARRGPPGGRSVDRCHRPGRQPAPLHAQRRRLPRTSNIF